MPLGVLPDSGVPYSFTIEHVYSDVSIKGKRRRRLVGTKIAALFQLSDTELMLRGNVYAYFREKEVSKLQGRRHAAIKILERMRAYDFTPLERETFFFHVCPEFKPKGYNEPV